MTEWNQVILTGRVAKPPQRSFRPDGSSVVQFSLEVDNEEDRSSRSGRSLIDIVAFDLPSKGELEGVQMGQRLRVEGRLKQRRWQTPEGKNRSRIEVVATDFRMVKGGETE